MSHSTPLCPSYGAPLAVEAGRRATCSTTFTYTGIEVLRKVLDTATAGDNVGLLLDGATSANCSRSTVLRGS